MLVFFLFFLLLFVIGWGGRWTWNFCGLKQKWYQRKREMEEEAESRMWPNIQAAMRGREIWAKCWLQEHAHNALTPQHPTKHGTLMQCIVPDILPFTFRKKYTAINFWIKESLTPDADPYHLPTYTHTDIYIMLIIKLYFEVVRTYTLSLVFSLSLSLFLSPSYIQMEQQVIDNMQHAGLNTTHRDQNIDADIARDKNTKTPSCINKQIQSGLQRKDNLQMCKYWPNTRANMLTSFCT